MLLCLHPPLSTLTPRPLPPSLPSLQGFFKELKEAKSDLGIVDIQLSLSTLEEVFLNIARAAELETAQAEGRFESIVLADGTDVQVGGGERERGER